MRRRLVHLARIRELDPVQDYAEIYRLTTLYEFTFDVSIALQLAFYRTYAVPSISALLAHTGHIEHDPVKRAEDTGLLIFEMIEHGFDHPRARTALRVTNGAHRPWTISNEDYLYVLGTFMFVPFRWLDRYGWRRPVAAERVAAYHFYRELGLRMGIRDIPGSWEKYEHWFDTYEREHFAHTPANTRLLRASQQLIADRFPPRARGLGRLLGLALLDLIEDEPLRRALGVPRTPWVLRGTVKLGFRLRAVVQRFLKPRTSSSFTPGGQMKAYPDGYQLSDLGPATPRIPGLPE